MDEFVRNARHRKVVVRHDDYVPGALLKQSVRCPTDNQPRPIAMRASTRMHARRAVYKRVRQPPACTEFASIVELM